MSKNGCIYVMATLDTKEKEAVFLRDQLCFLGYEALIMDIGILKESPETADITQKQVLEGFEKDVAACTTRAEASRYMIEGAGRIVTELYQSGRLSALISLGGSGGCGIASAVMHCLPLGVPKVIVTTMASGNTLPYVMGEDILLINPVVDIQNLNAMTRYVLKQAAAVLDGMLKVRLEKESTRAVAVSGFGVTTPCVDRCTELLETAGYEVFIFHARGISGGKIMEKMIDEGFFSAVLDITTSEVADEFCGGIYGVPERMSAAVKAGIPYVVAPGALEMINLSTPDTLNPLQKKRVLYRHSPSSVKMRADVYDMEKLADVFAERLGKSTGKVKLLIPEKGFSSVDAEGCIFENRDADDMFIRKVKEKMPLSVPVICCSNHINDKAFADRLVEELLAMLNGGKNSEAVK